ncbi:MAG: tetratricopeptide repeat protein [Planctomycetes bacterium]|nr:tetratricopeptide repeat protein [Planctomycetota bacterium]
MTSQRRTKIRAGDSERTLLDSCLPTETPRISRLHIAAACALLAAVGAGVYANSMSGPFIYDDHFSIVVNEHIRNLWPLSSAMSAEPNTPVAGRPVIALSLALNYALGGLDVRGYHLVNISVHVLCSLVLFALIRRTLLTPALGARFGEIATPMALACSLIWMVHPLVSECVNYITQRTESIMGLFYLLTMYCAILAGDVRGRRWWSVAAVISCALGMASKGVMMTAPLMVMLYDLAFRNEPVGRVIRGRWRLYAALAGTWIILVFLMYPSRRPATVGFGHGVGPLDYARVQSVMIGDYLRLAIWPHPLVLDYGRMKSSAPAAANLYRYGVLVLLAGSLLAFLRRRAVGFAGVWFFLILGPTSSFVPILSEVGAERRMYLPLAGLVVAALTSAYTLAAWAVRRLWARKGEATNDKITKRTACLVAVLLATALALATVRRNEDYRSEESIWRTAVEARPRNERAQTSLGAALLSAGKTNEALPRLREAVGVDPAYCEAHYYLGRALEAKGRFSEAIGHYHIALEDENRRANVHTRFGAIAAMRGKYDEAMRHFNRAIALDPKRPGPAAGAAWMLATKADSTEAEKHQAVRLAEQACKLTEKPNYRFLDALAAAQARVGRFDDAVKTAEAAVQAARAAGKHLDASRTASRLALYRKGRPYVVAAKGSDATGLRE